MLSALLLAACLHQCTQQWIHFKPPNLLLPLRPAVQPRNQNHKTSNRTPSTHRCYHAFHGSTVAPSSPHNTHSNPTLLSHASSSNLKIHFSLTGQTTSQPQKHLSPHVRVTTPLPRGPCPHTPCLPAESHGHASQHKATSSPPAKYPSTRPTRGFTPFQLFWSEETLRIILDDLCCGSSVSVFRSRKWVEGERMRPCGLSRCQGPLPLATIPYTKKREYWKSKELQTCDLSAYDIQT